MQTAYPVGLGSEKFSGERHAFMVLGIYVSRGSYPNSNHGMVTLSRQRLHRCPNQEEMKEKVQTQRH